MTLLYVVLPQILPFVIVSMALGASISIAEPVMSTFLLNDSSATLAQKSFQGLRFNFDPFVLTAAGFTVIIVMLATIIGIVLMNRLKIDL